MILVTGAGGKTGTAVIRALRARRAVVRALVFHDDQVQRVKELGARETIVGDMRKKATLSQAVRNVQAIYHICPNVSPDEVRIGRALVSAARAARVERFVYHSVLHPQTKTMPHHWKKLRVEAVLFESGIPYTILQSASYMQNILTSWEAVLEDGVYRVPYGTKTRLAIVDLADVAEVASIVLTQPGHFGATYELAGPEVLAQTEMADILTRQLGRPVRVETIAVDKWVSRALVSGMGHYQVDALVRMFDYYGRYGFWGSPNVLAYLLGRSPTTFESFVERAIQERRSR